MRGWPVLLAVALAAQGAGAQGGAPAAPAPPPGAFSEPSTAPPRPGGSTTPPAMRPAPGAAAGPAQAPAAPPPQPFESWRFNARERTGRGLAAWENQKPAEAVEALDTAARLRPDDALATYNSGTAHLGAGLGDAAQILERALASAPPELAPDGYYNLGNARLAAQEPGAAVDAYKESLRRAPGHAGARRNLELALKMLEEQQKQQPQQQSPNPDSKSQQDGEGQPQPNGSQNPNPDSQQPQQPSQGEPQPGESQPQPQPGAGSERQSPLPQFQDQQDMSAEQAASILQAVENLERERRREEAKARARSKTSVEKDW
jgi:hypothetical protein